MSQGRLVMYVGTMFGGKSHALLFHVDLHSWDKRIKAFIPAIDSRDDRDAIVTHSGRSYPATRISDPVQIKDELADIRIGQGEYPSILLIDEAHMFGQSLVGVVLEQVSKGMEVVCGGLTVDYRGVPFDVVTTLMAFADVIKVYRATCKACHEQASRYNARLVEDERRIVPGGEGVYEPQCYRCFHRGEGDK